MGNGRHELGGDRGPRFGATGRLARSSGNTYGAASGYGLVREPIRRAADLGIECITGESDAVSTDPLAHHGGRQPVYVPGRVPSTLAARWRHRPSVGCEHGETAGASVEYGLVP